jgi:DNA-binding LacI/PurR family transcriptional regulator
MSALSAKGMNRLPPERELCTEFGVSLITIKKVIRQLAIEGRIFSALRKGHFIRTVPAETNIGIVIGEGSVSTFLKEPEVIGGILDVLAKRNCAVRIIQVSKPQEASRIFSQYKIDGCVWYLPHPSLYPKISKVIKGCNIPIVVPVVNYTPPESVRLPENHFANDFTAVGRARAEYLLSCGHRKIVYCANIGTEAHDGFTAALKKVGIVQDPDWNLPKIEEIPEKLPGLLDAGEVTAIISDGGRDRLEAVFRVMEGHPWNRKGDLLIDFIGGAFSELRESHPGVRITAINFYPHHELGSCAAEALVDAVKEGRPIVSAKFVSQVRPPDWTPYRKSQSFGEKDK